MHLVRLPSIGQHQQSLITAAQAWPAQKILERFSLLAPPLLPILRPMRGGNTSTCSFSVIVIDDTSPTIACPSNITVSANASCQATVNWAVPMASDNCGGPVTLTSTNTPGSIFPLGSTTVTYTATDVAGNVATCSFAVIVEDNTAPQISGCSDVIVSAGSSCKANASWTAPVATDCGSVTITSSHNAGDIFDHRHNASYLHRYG